MIHMKMTRLTSWLEVIASSKYSYRFGTCFRRKWLFKFNKKIRRTNKNQTADGDLFL